MQGTEQDINSAITAFVENVLIDKIRDLYSDVTTTTKYKRTQREKYTNQFVKTCSEKLSVPEEKVRSAVDVVIHRQEWIQEIEDMEEEK